VQPETTLIGTKSRVVLDKRKGMLQHKHRAITNLDTVASVDIWLALVVFPYHPEIRLDKREANTSDDLT
jgi:hypothetical protein